jgi:hypothetical protein
MLNNKDSGKYDRPRGVEFVVPFETKPDSATKVVAYAFDRAGNFLTSSAVDNEEAHLALTPEQARRARIFFGPALAGDREKEPPTLAMMEQMRAYEPVWEFNPEANVQKILPIPAALSKFWLWCQCRVRGRVVKPVTIGGTTQDLPICNARVHICEVDPWPWFILKLPDDLIFKLRDDLLQAEREPFPHPIPLPDPPPFKFDPGYVDPVPENIARMNGAQDLFSSFDWSALERPPAAPGRSVRDFNAVALNPQPLPPRQASPDVAARALNIQSAAAGARGTPGEALEFNPQPDPPGSGGRRAMALEARAALMSSSANMVRQSLLANVQLLRPFLCLWPWWWWWWRWYRCDEVAVLQTNSQGRFDTTIWYLCFGDHPDLYFWVEYNLGGTWTTVLRPPIACNTYWDYVCGTDVTLRVTDPRVAPCGGDENLPGLQVAILSIGDAVSVHEIQPAAAGASEGLTTAGEPFGGSLEPHVWFGRTALIAAGITHYRWSYRRLTLSDGIAPVSDGWHTLGRQVIRHYAVIDPTPPDFSLSFPPYVLGPDPAFAGQDLFQIQPVDPPPGSDGWAPIDAHEDSASAFFLTHLLEGGDAEAAAGKYELKFELFRSDGSLVNITDAGVLLKVANVDAPFGAGTVTTSIPTAEHLILDSGGKTIGFRMVVRVDNNPCEAQIYTISGAGLTVDADCGFINYAPGTSAHISFKARHRHNFATFSFSTYRGTSINVPEATAAGSVGANPVNGFARSATSIFSKDVLVSTLLTSNTPSGHTPCTKAAFAENLYVAAMATDGWSRLSGLDAAGLPVAFALEPA